MSLLAPPFRFLGLLIGGWACGRAAFLMLGGNVVPHVAPLPERQQTTEALQTLRLHSSPAYSEPAEGFPPRAAPLSPSGNGKKWEMSGSLRLKGDSSSQPPMLATTAGPQPSVEPPIPPRLTADPQPQRQPSLWSGSAWLFARESGSGAGLATGGQLGGSQAGMRIAYRAAELGKGSLAVAARLSAPLNDRRGAEGAVAIDWRPSAGLPLRLSAERRFAIGSQGRDAWAAYAAGGFWRSGLPGGMEADGYAQAGVVGARKGDLFADGALRLGLPIIAGERSKLLLGGGAWAAAQPGASRVDVGPRAALSLTLGGRTVSGSVDWRFRVAGRARPGSGLAMTLAADF